MGSNPAFTMVEEVAAHVVDLVPKDYMAMVEEFIMAHEYGLALETLLDYLVDELVAVDPADAALLAGAAEAMGTDRYSRDEIESLAAPAAGEQSG